MKISPILSILIPTRNRQKYALDAVAALLSIKETRFEIILQDNSDDKKLSKLMEKYFEDERLHYFYVPPPLSSIDNFCEAIKNANGEYICLIGDDDGVNKEIVDIVAWAQLHSYDCIVGSLSATYRWPDAGVAETLFTKAADASLIINQFSGAMYQIDAKKSLEKLLKNGCTNYLEFPFPKLYHGVVKRDYMEKLKKQCGNYLNGLSPDIYAAVSMSLLDGKFLVVDYPLTIPGVCSSSGSVIEGIKKTCSINVQDAPQWRDNIKHRWCDYVPRIYTADTIWADSALTALIDFNENELINKFNKYRLCAYIVSKYPEMKKPIYVYLRNSRDDYFTGKCLFALDILFLFIEFLRGPLIQLFKRVWRRALMILKKQEVYILHEVNDIYSATNELASYLELKKISYKDIFL